ncbi:MAG: hypothetical protein ACLPZJ_08540 [Terriglobales bacterium]
MSLTRPNLERSHPMLDEQSFQGLLSAAFTIQEHNDQAKKAQPTSAQWEARDEPEANPVCLHCGASKPAKESLCANCGVDQFRPGERLQRNWASMWLMSQERGLWPERPAGVEEGTEKARADTSKAVPPSADGRRILAPLASQSASNGLLGLTGERTAKTKTLKTTEGIRDQALDRSLDQALDPAQVPAPDAAAFDPAAIDKSEAQNEWTAEASAGWEDSLGQDSNGKELTPGASDHIIEPLELSEGIDSSHSDATSIGRHFADWRVTLRFHRADVYLGVAILVAVVALLWPAASSQRQPTLGLMDRALISLGIAEAPAPVAHVQGDPGIEVWVDPHTALYYCPGEEQYGKTADGRFTSQRDAEMDRFEPAGRSACE